MKKIALCIGNDNYELCLGKLNCAVNDSNKMSAKLKDLGFDVENYSDLDSAQMHEYVTKFEEKLKDYDVALFYFAGHGFESKGENRLMPIDIDSIEVGKINYMALELKYVLDALEGKTYQNNVKTKIIILDACRTILNGRGIKDSNFAAVMVPLGTIIAFSTSPGQIAYEDKTYGHGYFTKALLKSIDIPRMPIEKLFKRVREQLSGELNGVQIPWEHTSLMGDFYFNEDNLESGFSYLQSALADSSYFFEEETLIKNIVQKLKSYDYYIQNPAIVEIQSIDFNEESANNLFILGRNIYQAACGDSFNAISLIDNFVNLTRIPNKAKIHILNGMAYEIYFDKNGKIRKIFKSKLYLKILHLLELEVFQASRNFVNEVIKDKSNKIIYLPGKSNRFDFFVKNLCVGNNGAQKIYKIIAIFYLGVNILHIDKENDLDEMYGIFNLHGFKTKLARTILAPLDMIELNFEVDCDEGLNFAFHMDSELIIELK